MSNYSISGANLNVIEKNLNLIDNNINVLAKSIEIVSNQVDNVDNKVNSVNSELNNLATEFRNFVNESRRVANLADAKQTVVLLEQELEKKFGNYDIIRNHTVGILQASDLSIVKKETIENATEEMMIATPRYWLAPALIALSAWLSDNKELADKALREAIRRDDEKTSLLFCLISRRAGKLDGSLIWLERYFAMQDPEKMERKIIAVLDAFASGLFGGDANGICSEKIKDWLDELSSKAGFVEKQREQWQSAILARQIKIDDNDFSLLKEYSPTWEKMKDTLEFAETHEEIYKYFSNIFNVKVENTASVSAKVDEILDNLVKNYDIEELPIRGQLRKNRLTIEENGDIDRANRRYDEESKAYEEYENFSQHLTSVALSPESSGALIATQKLAISLSKDWIVDAYEDLTAKNRASVPLDVEIEVANWKGKTRDGENEEELKASLNTHLDKMKEEQLSKLKWPNIKVIAAGVIGIIIAILAIATIIVPIVVLAGVGLYIFREKVTIDKAKKDVINNIENLRENSGQVLNGFLAEVVDFRRLYLEKDGDSQKVIDLLKELTPEQYITIQDGKKVRQVL